MSGLLLDRIDLHVEVPAVSLLELRSGPGEPTRIATERVAAARLLQQECFSALRPHGSGFADPGQRELILQDC